MLQLCSNTELESLSSAAVSCKPSKTLTNDQKSLVLAIRKLKRFMANDSDRITTWIYTTLKLRRSATPTDMTDPVNQALVDLITNCISFQEATNNTSSLDTLFQLVKKETLEMGWLLCLIGEKLPQLVTRRIHEHLILGFALNGNPYLGISNSDNDIVHISNHLFQHLLQGPRMQFVVQSVVDLLDQYLLWIKDNASLSTDLQRFTLGYLLSLPKISPALFQESWSTVFKRLLQNDTAGTAFLYEKTAKSSLVKTSDGVQDLVSVFPRWLTTIAFDSKGLIMKHALDVAIMLDTLAHDTRLDLTYLIPTGDKSIIDTLKPSFEQLDLKPTSIDLVQWTISIVSSSSSKQQRGVDDLKIPLFLLQLVILKDGESKEMAVDMFVQLITRLDRPTDLNSSLGARYLALNLVSSAESKWPGIFQLVLENIFSKAIAMHIADSEGSVNIEKILANLAMLFEPPDNTSPQQQPGFHAFQAYLTSHWRQVLLLFLNHPSMECRAMGYRVLTNSHFWEKSAHVEGCDPQTISKLLMDAWFRHIKGRYLRFGQEEEISVVDEQQRLIAYCCQQPDIAKTMLSFAIDGILGGALEIFPSVDVNALQQEKLSLFDKVRQEENEKFIPQQAHQTRKPPQFVTTIEFLTEEEFDVRDKIYVDNIQRTAALFFQFSEQANIEQFQDVSAHILSRLTSIWSPNAVPLDSYDDVLPRNIPYQCDIDIGNAFKDHPVLFLIFEKYTSVQNQQYSSSAANEIARSILVYFIVFWHMKEVVNIPTALRFATQLEETTRLILLLKPVLPQFLVDAYRVFPFMSAKDLGDILFQVVWYYLRWHPATSNQAQIPGIKAKTTVEVINDNELNEKCFKRLMSICESRLKLLESVPSWHQALQDVVSTLNTSSNG
ncbi:hypothetical protein HMPREF1544_06379 [Mucor circinelloides 1006PhL]|uniref:Integrator complex subunit 5 C-terminal domain-containing protein n=1 Tax=Mucor circinelloides f. circinelloides (strain 1006PhL) TaxID=1220926 RepID=S2JAZ5_MUCC1|nr:hypothetical protein HMPREF1544_06379 [Mucor circinelloides 1006PhL]